MVAPLPAPARPELGPLLVRSWGVVRSHPVVVTALGGAVLLSFASMLFGIGVVVTPWFVCEIFALQLAVLTDRPTDRSVAWIRAAAFVLGMTGVVVAATWMAALAIGPDVSTADASSSPLPWPEATRRVALIAAVTGLTVGFIAPFQYVPLILIERGGTVGSAVLESAWLVRRGGLARHWLLAFAAHLLPLVPALVAAVVVARTFERAATPLGVLAGLPLMPLTIPLGQGLLTAAYVERRGELSDPRWTRREGKPPRSLVVVLVALVVMPMLGLALLAAGALRPAPASPGPRRDAGPVVLDRAIEGHRDLHLPDATLVVRVRESRVTILAPDGEEVRMKGGWSAPVDRVRVRRRDDRYTIEAHADGWWWIEVDRSAVRTDDSVADRIERRLPPWGLPAIALAFGLSALLLVRALEPLGTIRRLYGAPATDRPPVRELAERRRAAVRAAWMIALALAGPAVAALAAGAIGLVG